MPIFDFTCLSCKQSFEDLVRTAEDMPKKCPFCLETTRFVKEVSAPRQFNFKGKGFYATDHPKDKKIFHGDVFKDCPELKNL